MKVNGREFHRSYQVALLSEVGCHTVQEFDDSDHEFGAVKAIAERFNVAWRPVAQTCHVAQERHSNGDGADVATMALNTELTLEVRYMGLVPA